MANSLFNKIVDILLPYMGTETVRQTRLVPILSDYKGIYNRIDWSGDAKTFTVRLVKQCEDFGDVEVGKPAQALLLEALRPEVGVDIQMQIDGLLAQLVGGKVDVSKSKVQIIISGDIVQYNKTIKNSSLITILASILGISKDAISILKVIEGSIRVIIEMPTQSANQLLKLFQSSNSKFSILSDFFNPFLIQTIQVASDTENAPPLPRLIDNSQLVNALLSCPSISDPAMRGDIINLLPNDIRNNIPRRSSARADVRNIVKTCQDYSGGLEKLLETIRNFEGNSLPLQEVERLVVKSGAQTNFSLSNKPNRRVRVNLTMSEKSRSDKSYKIFMAHSESELDYLVSSELSKYLIESNCKVVQEQEIHQSKNWGKKLKGELEKADCFMILLSENSLESQVLMEQLVIAKDISSYRQGSPIIIPVRINLPNDHRLPYHLSVYLRDIFQEEWNDGENMLELAQRVIERISTNSEKTYLETKEDLVVKIKSAHPQPSADPRSLIVPGGAIELSSKFYVLRNSDEKALKAIYRPRAMVNVRGARQTGKTSLIIRLYHANKKRKASLRSVFFDFQAFPSSYFQSLDSIWKVLANMLANQLAIKDWDNTKWDKDGFYAINFTNFLNDFVFDRNKTPVLICIDEGDRVFNTPLKSDFYASLRSFYNQGAMEECWGKIHWLIATSTEPSFFIDDISQSPFNIGTHVQLDPFNIDEIKYFANQYKLNLLNSELEAIMNYTGGLPFLVHLILFNLSSKLKTLKQLLNIKTAGDGVFLDHLNRFLIQFHQDKALSQAMKKIVIQKDPQNGKLVNRLEAAGLVKFAKSENEFQILPFCDLYREFFRRGLINE